MLKIGNLKLSLPFILAPMSGVTDLPFRLINRKFGCELAFVEMINVRSLSYKSKRTERMLSADKKDRPLGIQLLGSEPQFILRGMDVLNKYKFDILDFNAACPEKKVTRRGEGASLLKEPKKLNQLLKLIVHNSKVPVTVKIRTGWDRNSINAKELALYAQDAGVKALFLHGRTKAQGYHGNVDYTTIRKVKKALSIPVIASGDIFSCELAKKMLEETGCDGVLVARGALGNPWIFRELSSFFTNGRTLKRPDIDEIGKVMLEHLNLCLDFYGPRIGVIIFRKFFSWYTKGHSATRILRKNACRAKTPQELIRIIEEFQQKGKK